MKYLLPPLSLLILGCQQPSYNTVSYKYATCKDTNNVGVRLIDGVYKCFYKEGDKVVYSKPKVVHKKPKHDFKNPSWINTAPIQKCETTITNVYKDGAVRCRGKILEAGQKTRIVNK